VNLAIYVLIYTYINAKINDFMETLMTNVMGVLGGVALVLATIWIMIQGYRIITGQSRDSMIGFTVNAMRVMLIITAATTLGIFGPNVHDLFTQTLPNDLNQVFTGDNSSINDSINKNLSLTVLAMSAIDVVQSAPGDVQTENAKARASDFAIFGTISPPMTAGAMLLMYNLAIALVVGLGPLFILCLIFEQTKGLFQTWLMYGIGTLFAMAMLSFVTSLVLQVTARAAAALWASDLINSMMGTNSEGITTASMEQGGIGLLMSVLIISAPPMAAMFFRGTLGSFSPYSPFQPGVANHPGPQGQPPGSYGGGSGYAPPVNNQQISGNQTTNTSAYGNHGLSMNSQQTAPINSGSLNPNPQYPNAPVPPPSNR
jgi:type IV secretion system protein VirB6